jgi:type I restriction enzyme, S subunit
LVVALAGQGKTKGMVAQLGIDSTCNQSMAAISLYAELYSRYLFWWLTSNYQNIRNMAGGDLRDGLNLEHLGSIQCPLPSRAESTFIANFLDHETTQIDSLIEKQQLLIQLLKEKRQAVISHAVTKGLNPNVPMKDSDVEWLGQVPEHWTVSKLKYFASIQGGFAFSSDLFIEEGTQVLRIGNVYQNSLSLDRQPIFIASDLVKNFQDFIVKKDDVLMSLTGTLGKRDYGFAIKVETDDQYLLNQRVAKISPNKKIDTDFMVYVLWSESYLTQLYSLPSGTKQANLSNSDVLGIAC